MTTAGLTYTPTIVVTPTAEALATRAADWLVANYGAAPTTQPHAPWVWCVATGHTPLATYQHFAARIAAQRIATDRMRILHLDEYVGLATHDPHSFASFVRTHVVEPLHIPPEHVAYWHGDANDAAAECARYAAQVSAWHDIDALMLGLGANGHIAFNEPGVPVTNSCHIVPLHAATLAQNARDLGTRTQPTHAFTIGIGMIVSAKKILLLVSGAHKHAPLKRLLTDTTATLSFPASFLHTHPAVTIITDAVAFGDLTTTLPRHTYEAA